jgi:hypothetical protein
MGNDTPLAVLSKRSRLFFDYFHQLFAQVTNPPLDAIREELVTSLVSFLGKQGNLLSEAPELCRMLRVKQPLLTEAELETIRATDNTVVHTVTLPMLFAATGDGPALKQALADLCARAEAAVADGKTVLILSDRDASPQQAPIPSLLAVSAVHQYLVTKQLRAHAALVVDAGDPREVHHFATLLGFGADAICPYWIRGAARPLRAVTYLDESRWSCAHYIKAVNKAFKVMSKMGISTLQSYRGAQIFEIVGLNSDVTDRDSPARSRASRGRVGADRRRGVRSHALFRGAVRARGSAVGRLYHWRARRDPLYIPPRSLASVSVQRAIRRCSRNT